MSTLEYYKTLVSDDEVITALVRESKAREGEFEKTRVRPNMNFLHRTVSNMVSSNKRITSRQEKIIAEEKEKNTKLKPRRVIERKRTARELINEILTSQTKFVKSCTSEGLHFDKTLGNSVETYVSQQEVDERLQQPVKEVIDNQCADSLLISSDDEVTKDHMKAAPENSSVIVSDCPIQISSDEGITDSHVSGDVGYLYRKKKCKKRHKVSKCKKKLKT